MITTAAHAEPLQVLLIATIITYSVYNKIPQALFTHEDCRMHKANCSRHDVHTPTQNQRFQSSLRHIRQEEHEDTKRVVRIRKLKKDRQYNGQKRK